MKTTLEIQLGSRNARVRQKAAPTCCALLLGIMGSLAACVAGTAVAAPNVKMPAPTVTKAFSPAQVYFGGTTRMTITLSNGNAADITGVQFTDSYPGGIANASSNVLQANTCGGTLTADADGTSVSLINGTIPASSHVCSIVLNVVATAAGAGTTVTNHTGLVISTNAFAGADATADLQILDVQLMQAPTVSMTALPGSISIGGVASTMISLANPNFFDIWGAQFTINYPAPLHLANAPGGAIFDESGCAPNASAPPGGASFSVTDATIPAASTCLFILGVTGTTVGDSDLHTGPVLSGNANPAADTSVTLSVAGDPLLPAPRLAKTFSPPSIKVGGTSQMTLSFTNQNMNNAVTGLQQADFYPANIANAPGALVSNTCGGVVLLHAHDGIADDFRLFDGTIPPGGICSVVVNVTGIIAANLSNSIINERNGNALSGNMADAPIVVTAGALLGAPSASKTFAPSSVNVGGPSQMTITLNNANSSDITGVQLTDDYPDGMINAPNNPIASNTCDGTVTTDANGHSLSLVNGSIKAIDSCKVVINVVGNLAGSWISQTSAILSANALAGASAVGGLTVVDAASLAAPTVTKTFAPQTITVGDTSEMTITLANSDAANSITGAQFTDLYPGGMANAASGVLISNTCGGSVTAPQQGFSATLVGGTITPSGSCAVVLNVVGTSAAIVNNHTGSVFSTNAQMGLDAVGTLNVVGGGAAPQTIAFTSTAPANAKVGGPMYVATAQATSSLPVTLTIDASSSTVCTINGSTVSFIGVGTCTIDANQAGDAVFAPAPQVQQSFAVASASGVTPQTITFTSTAPANATVGGPVYAPTAAATSNLSVALTIDAAAVTVCTMNGGNVSFIGAGTCIIDANQGGDANFAPAPQIQQSFAVAAANGVTPQIITFNSTAPFNATVGGPSYAASAQATSNLSVALTIDATSATVCTISNGIVSFIGVGTCTIDANQGGNATFAPAPQVQQSFAVAAAGGGASQTIAFTSQAPANAMVAGWSYVVTAHATSNLPVTLTIDASADTVCTINNGTVSFVGAGLCVIDANQGGDAAFAPAPQAQQFFAVAGASGALPQTIMFTSPAPANAKVGGSGYGVAAHATSNLPVVLTIDAASDTVCTINNTNVSFVGAGTCVIDANQGGDATFAAAPQMQQSFAVAASGGVAPQTIAFTSTAPVNAKVGGPAYVATAHATSNLPVILTIDAASNTVCAINNGSVSLIGIGTCTIDANQGGDATFAAAPQVQQSFAVATAGGVTPQTISFTSTAPANASVGGLAYVATAHATSNLPIVLTIDATAGTVCTINNGTVSFIGVGTCTIDANQGGNPTFAPAAQVQQSFAVGTGVGGGQPIAVGDAVEVTSGGTATTLVGDPKVPASLVDNDLNVATAEIVAGPTHAATFTLNADGTFAYQNNGDASATDSFTYRARNAQQVASNVATVTITIGNGLDNHLPFAVDDAIEVTPGGSATRLVGNPKTLASLLDNDSEPDAGDTLTATKLTDPAHGTVTLAIDGTFGYQNDGVDPATDDDFIYEVCDNHGACDVGGVTITIGSGSSDHLPIVVDDAIQTTPFGTATTLIGDLNNPASVLDNDSDPDAGDGLTALNASGLLNASGDLTFAADGSFTYQNTDAAATSDSFFYEACDPHGACKGGTVTITIGNDPPDLIPVAMSDAIMVGPNGTSAELVGDANAMDSVLDNDTDPGDTLEAYVISPAANGDVMVNPDGTFTYTNTNAVPGNDSFVYEACDSFGACVAATVSITIDPSAPLVTCTMPAQLNMVGDAINLDLSLLFAPPPGKSLSYSVTNPPPPLSIVGSLLAGTLDTSGIFMSTLKATTVPGGVSTTENVQFTVLPAGEILFRHGFEDGSASPVCQ